MITGIQYRYRDIALSYHSVSKIIDHLYFDSSDQVSLSIEKDDMFYVHENIDYTYNKSNIR